ncbi:glucoamylase family protein [Chlamydiota bacterium]
MPMKKNFRKRIFFLIISLLFIYPNPTTFLAKSDNENNYLNKLYKSTFSCIYFFTNSETGLPYDVSDYRTATSLSNIGLYVGSVAVAAKTGLIPENEAIKVIEKVFISLGKIQKWHGFPITWINVKTLKRSYGASFSYADHIGNLVCGLLVVAGIFPNQFTEIVENIIGSMQFSKTYDATTGWLKGGFNIVKKEFSVKQSWGDWYYNLLASDTRHFSLLAITLGEIPKDHWHKLQRDDTPMGPLDYEILLDVFGKKHDSTPYFSPGMHGGGLFMQFLPGIFLKEKELPIGISARNFAWCQITYAKINGIFPLWGYSACESPNGNGYLGWSSLKKIVVTPHASVLAIDYFPKEVLKNLFALEKNGMRRRYIDKRTSKGYDFGFKDSYNFESEIVSKHYLCLDQCMIFLSLANYLYNDIVRISFNNSSLGKEMHNKLSSLEEKYTWFSVETWINSPEN